jgi:branched-chain amino acid transport system substrate-binding protein
MPSRKIWGAVTALAVGLTWTANARAAELRGVTDTEIVIGTITDLSGVTAVQGVNNSDALRMAFDEANAKGGIHGRKIKYIVEDNQYTVPRAVQAMNKLLNNDNVFFTIADGGTPMNDANMPVQFAKNVPNVLPLTAARSMYEPYNRLKFAQFASYYDEMRSAVKYFAEKRGRKAFCVMYQDSDFGKDVLAGVVAQTEAMGMKIAATSAHRPTDTDFNGAVSKLHRGLRCGHAGHDRPRYQHHRADRPQDGLEGRFRRPVRRVRHGGSRPARGRDGGFLLHDTSVVRLS